MAGGKKPSKAPSSKNVIDKNLIGVKQDGVKDSKEKEKVPNNKDLKGTKQKKGDELSDDSHSSIEQIPI